MGGSRKWSGRSSSYTGRRFSWGGRAAAALVALAAFVIMSAAGRNAAFAAGEPAAKPATDVTPSSFSANWEAVEGTAHYYLDVATDSGFVNKIRDGLDAGTSTTYSLTGLDSVTNYFYRVKAGSSGAYSEIVYVQTPAVDGEYSSSSPATSGNEYSISTAAQLKELADAVNGGAATYSGVKFKLADNIDLAAYRDDSDAGGSGWTPIGVSMARAFQGKFDGNGYVVKNMFIDRPSTDSVGLFGYLNGVNAEIKNVGVVDCEVTGGSRVGAVAGWAYGSGAGVQVTVSECFSTGSVAGNRYIGGIVGEAETTSFTIKNCYSTVDVTGTRNDYNLDEGDAGFGGIVGYIYAPGAKTTTIANTYSTGAVRGPNCVGGIIGGIEIRVDSGISINISNSVALNKSVTATFATSAEDTDGVYRSSTSGLRSASLQNRVIGGIWENTVNGSSFVYTTNLSDLYALDSMPVLYNASTPVSGSKIQTSSSQDGQSITATDLENNAHNWTDGAIDGAGGAIAAGSVTYFDYTDAGGAASVWYYYQNKEVLPVLHRYLDNYQQVPISLDSLNDTVPSASDVYANSTGETLQAGNTFTASYAYHDNDAGAESGSTYRWYRYGTEKGGDAVEITGAHSRTYALTSADVGKYLSFTVTPKSASETGLPVESDRTGPMQAIPVSTVSIGLNGTGADNATSPTAAAIRLYGAASALLINQDFYLYLDGTYTGSILNTGAEGAYTYSIPSTLAPGNHTLRAESLGGDAESSVTFIIPCTVSYAPGAHGTLAGASSERVVVGGKAASVPNVTPDPGFAFAGWSSDGGGTLLTRAQVQAATVTGSISYTAYYVEQEENPETGDNSANGAAMPLILAGTCALLGISAACCLKIRRRRAAKER